MEQENAIENEKQEELLTTDDHRLNIDWLDLLLNIDLISLRILEKFYRNGNQGSTECFVFSFLYRELKGLKISKDTVLRRCHWLQDRGLLQIVEDTSPLIIWPVKGIEQSVRRLIFQAYSRILGEKKWE